ncbi:PREDICTED: low affinity immunoglobulin gamma Fc region receptor II-b isoform X2 [Chinchilla lanigera]|uniref:low affinity immunoglobulin gamma Fc region receptor II-b isoform X2 n=1 Tax=Chinchilla lanigera TaxID=34839 RepID=UPI000697EF14|nr:PREDICTED: low affinity immunoglobulin gamma Fc region receptor II-b isoform X2 [Chinchilla lanigera]
MGIPSFLPVLDTKSHRADCKPSQTLGHMLLWIAVLFLAPVAGTSEDLPKAVVRREPPWIQVLREDRVTLTCEGARSPGNHSTQWLHNGNPIPDQVQPSYRFTAKSNDSGDYRCQAGGTSLSDPVHLDVISDWLLLQTPQLVFQEGDVIVLRCHSWNNKPLAKVTFYQNGIAKKFFSLSRNFSIPQANHSNSGDYHCTGHIGRTSHSSQPVTITVQASPEPKSSNSAVVIIVAAVIGIATVAVVVAVAAMTYLKKKRTPALPGNPEHREMGETLPEELGEYSVPSGGSVMTCPGLPDGSEPARSDLFNLSDPEEAVKSEAENTITYSLLKHPETQEDETDHDYQNHI